MYGKGFLINSASWTASPTSPPAGYITPVMRVPQIVEEESAISRLKDAIGIVIGVIDPADCILKCTFNYLAAGATIAEAKTSMALPQHGPYGIAGLPVIQAGKFADGFNAVSPNQPWFYFGGGEILGAEEGKEWTGSITLFRFFGITGSGAWSAIVA